MVQALDQLDGMEELAGVCMSRLFKGAARSMIRELVVISYSYYAEDRTLLVLPMVTFNSQSFLSDLVMSTLPPSAMAICRPADL